MKNFMAAIAVGVAIAATAMPVLAVEELPTPTPEFNFNDGLPSDSVSPDDLLPLPDIGSESESVGEFGSEDNYADDIYQELLDKLNDVDFNFSGESDADGESESELEEGIYNNYSDFDSGFDLYANYDTYYGSISSTYLEYMRGYLPKLGFRDHYVGARTGQYEYIFAYGENLSYSGNLFTGRNVHVIKWWTNNNGSFSHNVESSFNLSSNNYLVYSDLSDAYPSLSDLSGFTLRQILILACITALVCTISSMYQVRKIRKLGMH